jgi:hypothetical protein
MKTAVEPCIAAEKSTEENHVVTNVAGEVRPGVDVEVESWHREAVKLQDFAGSKRIESAADLALAADDLEIIIRLKRAMTERKQFYSGPFNEKIKAIDGIFGELMAPVCEAEKIMKKKMSDCRTALHKETMEAK